MELVLEFVESVVVRHDFMGRRFRIDAVLDVRVHRAFIPRTTKHAALPFMESSV